MSAIDRLIQSSGRRLYNSAYDFVRRHPSLNHLAHKITQGESLHRFPLYGTLYRRYIDNKARRFMKRPPRLEVTLTDACNARCIMCPPEVHLGKTMMDHNLFERIVHQAEELGIRKMILTGGEPLLDKRLEDKILFAKAHRFDSVHMFTNGSLMNEKRSVNIIQSGLDSLTWSIDSSREEEYERIRIGLHYHSVIANLKRFVEIRRELGHEKPLTRVNLVTLPQNQESRREFRQFFGEFVDVVEVVDSHNFAGNEAGIVTNRGLEYTQESRYPCHLLFNKIVVSPQGRVNKCSIDYAPHAVMGDLKEQSLKEILFSERFLGIKTNHLKCDFSEPGCLECTHKQSWWTRE